MRFLTVLLLAASAASAQPRFVQTRGRDLIAPNGQKLLLRGINLGNWLVPEGYMFHFDHGPASKREIETLVSELIGPDDAERFWSEWRDRYITAADIGFIRASGFNSVRIPIHYSSFLRDDADGFRLLDRVVAACRDAGLWVILDMHAAPAGQTGTNIDDSFGYPWLFESADAQKQLVDVWTRLARHYRAEPAVLGYDLLNEPIPHYPEVQKYNSRLEPLYRRVTEAIRAVDPDHIVILGGAQWDSNFKVFGKPFARNLVYTFHKYWTEPTIDVIREYLEYSTRYNVPLWLGESGENNNEWIGQFRAVLEGNNIGWCFWPYKKMDAASGVVSFARPAHWDEVVEYAKLPAGTGSAEQRLKARPPLEHTRRAFQDLLEQIRFEHCTPNAGYLTALGLAAAH